MQTKNKDFSKAALEKLSVEGYLFFVLDVL